MESAALVMSVVNTSPAAASSTSNSLFNNSSNNESAVVNLLGQGIITLSDCMGSIKQLLSSLNDTSTQPSTAMQQVNGVCDGDSTSSDPSVINSIASLIKSSGKRLDFCIGRG